MKLITEYIIIFNILSECIDKWNIISQNGGAEISLPKENIIISRQIV